MESEQGKIEQSVRSAQEFLTEEKGVELLIREREKNHTSDSKVTNF